MVGGGKLRMQLSPFLRCFPYHRSPLQGTHGDRVAGDNTRSRHNLRHFSYCATSLCAPATQQQGAVACTLRQVRRSIRSPPCGSKSVFEVTHSVYKYAPNMLSVCGKRAVLRKSRRLFRKNKPNAPQAVGTNPLLSLRASAWQSRGSGMM